MNDSKHRYLNDPVFHNLVTHLEVVMESSKIEPSDMRSAVDVAIDHVVYKLRKFKKEEEQRG